MGKNPNKMMKESIGMECYNEFSDWLSSLVGVAEAGLVVNWMARLSSGMGVSKRYLMANHFPWNYMTTITIVTVRTDIYTTIKQACALMYPHYYMVYRRTRSYVSSLEIEC